jgi:hypothetical protein
VQIIYLPLDDGWMVRIENVHMCTNSRCAPEMSPLILASSHLEMPTKMNLSFDSQSRLCRISRIDIYNGNRKINPFVLVGDMHRI